MRISNSFSEGEIQVLEFVLQTLLRGGTPTMAARHKDFASLYRKVLSMRARIEKQRAPKSAVGTIKAPEAAGESSVGTVDAVDEAAAADDSAKAG